MLKSIYSSSNCKFNSTCFCRILYLRNITTRLINVYNPDKSYCIIYGNLLLTFYSTSVQTFNCQGYQYRKLTNNTTMTTSNSKYLWYNYYQFKKYVIDVSHWCLHIIHIMSEITHKNNIESYHLNENSLQQIHKINLLMRCTIQGHNLFECYISIFCKGKTKFRSTKF